jgi:hypothetical protein
MLAFASNAQLESQRDKIRSILKPCAPNQSFRELAQRLQSRTRTVASELTGTKAQELKTVAAACRVTPESIDDARYKDEVTCLVAGVANVADNKRQREYVATICAQRSFEFHAQCLFTIADNTDDGVLKTTINQCRSISAVEKRSQCLIDGLVKLEGTRGQSPFIPWFWNF